MSNLPPSPAPYSKHLRQHRPRWLIVLATLAGLALLLTALVAWLNVRGEAPLTPDTPAALTALTSPARIERGAYLARAGNCAGCHTLNGGAPFAGGLGVETPFGTVYTPNITPHPQTGIGLWSSSEFWRAMHHGRSRDGRLLYPAFPYPSFSIVTRDDSDALHAFLRSVPAVDQAPTPHELDFPFSTQAALAVWRALFFRPTDVQADPQQSDAWNRGRYLVQGLGHCAACHSERNILGGLNAEFAGGLMADQAWYAPSLASPKEAGVQDWPREDVVRLLKDGTTAHASVSGPMAEVVYRSTQHLAVDDLDAMAQFLATIPVRAPVSQVTSQEKAPAGVETRGARLYKQHCVACHGDQGQGVPAIYPALAGNRAVTLVSPNNLIQVIRQGGFAPSTEGHPRPFGMPPFRHLLDQDDIAAVATHIRQSWGNNAAPVSTLEVLRVR